MDSRPGTGTTVTCYLNVLPAAAIPEARRSAGE
jgi:hypothetical protein